jgi:hypothetical protein
MGSRNGSWRHGLRSNEAIARRKRVNELLREARASLHELLGSV